MTRRLAPRFARIAAYSGTIALAVVAPNAAHAQSACYVPGSGTVYRIKAPNAPAQCAPGHVEFPLGGTFGMASVSSGATAKPGGSTLPTTASGAFDFSNPNGFAALGTSTATTLPAIGAGTRLMWMPFYGALRAGGVAGTQWNTLGMYSVALGYNTIASDRGTVSPGEETTASGYHAAAMGVGALASGNYSLSLGAFTTASGLGATAIGQTTTASGQGALAMGNYTKAIGISSTAMGNYASTTGMTGAFVYGDASTTNFVGAPLDNSFVVRAQHFWFGTTSASTAPTGQLIATSTGAYLSTGGTWTNSSDIARKHAFSAIDGEDILARVAAMPVSTWTYNTEAEGIRHMGPTAQDFRKAFGLGDTEKAIATVDADGVSLAAIKALLARTNALSHENDELRAALGELTRRLTDIEAARVR